MPQADTKRAILAQLATTGEPPVVESWVVPLQITERRNFVHYGLSQLKGTEGLPRWYAPAARGGLISARRVRKRRDALLPLEKTVMLRLIPGY